ncbi:hypothetical protein [Chitinophaga sp.]|uniref:hypothetical protein n=1 Tax=Chitinophaga sp. TaxID=1869181 RepID=UPI0031DE8BC2
MKRTFFLLLLLVTYHPVLYAQLSVGMEYAIPVGNFRNNSNPYGNSLVRYRYGIGGAVKYLYNINRTFGLTAQGGLTRYHAIGDKAWSFMAVPIKVGANLRFHLLFVEPQVGLTYFADNATYYQNGSTTYGLNVGAYLTNRIQLSANYEKWNKGGFKAAHFGVRLAYTFGPVDSIVRSVAYDKTGDNWKKHKTFRALGWTSLGVGVPLTLVGLASAIASAYNGNNNPPIYQWMLGSGAVLTTSGIPLFILSHKYKKKAALFVSYNG